MKSFKILFFFSLFLFCTSCEKGDSSGKDENRADSLLSSEFADDLSFGSGGNGGEESGLITAGEWSDLENWDFWNDLLKTNEEFISLPDFWNFYTNNRIAVHINSNEANLVDAEVELLDNSGKTIWQSRTDNFGTAQLYINTFEIKEEIDLSQFKLVVDGVFVPGNLKFYENGVNEIFIHLNNNLSNRVELAFVVDATGSMSDEIEFLKKDLEDVIERVQSKNPQNDIVTASVFYRDQDDEYVTKVSDFQNVSNTVGFIRDQSANGGGDFPEAVHSALNDCMQELSWSKKAKTRIAFLLLDAPPHSEEHVINELQDAIKSAAKNGIKIIPITASGINKTTEFLMRSFSILTNAPYVFITNDSGIGNPHLEATVGDYDVEFLNDLMVRLISKYTE